jgi:uncharacterized lipoprotein YddW (UPF0748 family)
LRFYAIFLRFCALFMHIWFMKPVYLSLFLAFIFIGCSTSKKVSTPVPANAQTTPSSGPVSVDREFRAAWVATVANINWPSKPGLSVEAQQKEAIALLDSLASLNFNAVIFQVRPQADALYASELEPWSYYLTGEQGKAPAPFYDPLDFWIREAHARGMELHAWLNPYRVHHPSSGKLAATSLAHKMPDAVYHLEQGYHWFDPSLKSVQDHSLAVVMDIVKRYDVDGIHFDDYFYPYDSYNGGADFPDDKSWKAYQDAGGKLSRGDWRRESVNTFIKAVYEGIKEEKRHVKFGLSPFGIWRPGHPASIAGMDQYETLYADAKLWLNEGWVDYFTPQLYWPIGRIAQSYPVLLGWWQQENTMQRHLWPGINVSGVKKTERGADEIENQIMISRGMTPLSPGVVHWSIGPLVANDSLKIRLRGGAYRRQALVPETTWLGDSGLKAPAVRTEDRADQYGVFWNEPGDESFKTIVYYRYGSVWEYRILGDQRDNLFLNKQSPNGKLNRVEVAFIGRNAEVGKTAAIDF